MHLISVTSDFNHKYSLFNGQVFINSSHNKDNRAVIEQTLNLFGAKVSFSVGSL